MSNFALSPAADGAMLAAAMIPFHLLMSKMQLEQFAAEILAVMAARSFGFCSQKGNRVQIAAELTSVTGFFAAGQP
ncbi:MAG TPA: hypothetical protein VHT02_05525 [Methylocella sp.]|nr:hypothetical protein [Methylocella sp.]